MRLIHNQNYFEGGFSVRVFEYAHKMRCKLGEKAENDILYSLFRSHREYSLSFPTFIRPITINTVVCNINDKKISDNVLGLRWIMLRDLMKKNQSMI